MGTTSGPMRRSSPWVTGFAVFGGSMMLVIGIFQIVVGLTAIFEDTFYVMSDNYIFGFDVSTWGWIHLALGVLVAVGGGAVLAGQLWGRVLGIVLAALSAIANFLFLPYYPLWSMLIIAADVAVIWALTRYGRDEAMAP
ncbi:hypothetical protein KZZ52_06695 [Dactylosporangium sp. AC04546]|uniref:DUF7144 family membrane protein n=1 Tax=Dactylosporangium sp. AC04546 TaxID=2862460 RepID=UPI001EDCC588|nr:hypothetical protein [Dactylosporangium sp. AC04546]WVK85083.1 hypothetical protein KZZ52_06695 [Dactylosporangium sp. AC04546]